MNSPLDLPGRDIKLIEYQITRRFHRRNLNRDGRLWAATMIKLLNALFALYASLTAYAAQSGTYYVYPPERPTTAQIWNLDTGLERACSCESWGDPNRVPRQFRSDGLPLWGIDPKTNEPIMRDVGQCQINTIAHAEEVARLNLDVVNSAEDNAYYADILFKRNGLRDWSASQSCWQTKTALETSVSSD
jgi:hypothetical protein